MLIAALLVITFFLWIISAELAVIRKTLKRMEVHNLRLQRIFLHTLPDQKPIGDLNDNG